MADPLRVVLRDRARLDIEEAVDWYRGHADVETALAFVDAVEAGLRHLGNHPRSWLREPESPSEDDGG